MHKAVRGKVVPIRVEDEMKHSYLDYAMSVIVGRALPDVRDGVKPVHRRILYAMYELGLTAEKPHKKSARIVGEVLGKYHPHGDAAVYDAMVRMAQEFSHRYPLIDGHGNFGSVDGDAPAAMRYTEVRLSAISAEILADIDKETVDFVPNFDATLREPTVLPAGTPNLLVNGSAGIAVGMATNIPPHNLGEIVDAAGRVVDEPDVDVGALMEIVRGPDFPTGGIIIGREGIREAYRSGRGVIRVRAQARIEKAEGGKQRIVVTELPYQVNKARLVESIAELVRDRKVEGVVDLRDESDRKGLRIVIEVRREANPRVILNRLFKHTQMEETFGVIMLALVDGQPRVLTLRDMIYHYVRHRREVVRRSTRFDLEKARARLHVVEGLRIALAHLDQAIGIIRGSRTVEIARRGLMEALKLTEKQAQAILDMRLQRLTGLEREKVEQEHAELAATIGRLETILGDERLIGEMVKEQLARVKEKYADARRTQIVSAAAGKIEVEDLIAREDVAVVLTRQGHVKRVSVNSYRSQRRGGRGVSGIATKEEDLVEHMVVTTTHHFILFFTNRGKVYRVKTHEITEAGRYSKGTAVTNLIQVGEGEKVTAVVPVADLNAERYLLLATKRGVVKKTLLSAYAQSRRSGMLGLSLDPEDELIGVQLTSGEDELVLGTAGGQAIRFAERHVRPMGRTARGIKGIRLADGDAVIGMVGAKSGTDLLVVTEKGYGKITPLAEYRVQGRAGRGIRTLRLTKTNGRAIGIKPVKETDEVMLTSADGIMIRLPVRDIPRKGRNTQGVRLMRLGPGDSVVAVARLGPEETG